MSVTITTRNKAEVIYVSPTIYTLLDIDGNEYNTVIIGTQEWIVENLKTTHYADGVLIPNLTLDDDWIAEDGSVGHDGAMCYYDNDIVNKPVYGALYNWFAVDKKFDNWFLPSENELDAMYAELHLYSVGGFANNIYWSSSEFNNQFSYSIDFATGLPSVTTKGSFAGIHVRACRTFEDTLGTYSLRDIGPAGGYIFYKDGTTCYEAAISDVSGGQAWSNIYEVEIGETAQGTAIGTGQANTTAIINQAGHTNSAAKLCDDLILGPKLPYFERNGVEEVGWRVPAISDYNTLVTFLGGDSIAGGKLKEIGITHWDTPNIGATDNYGFKMIGSGYRFWNGSYQQFLISGAWWLSTEFDALIGSYPLVSNGGVTFSLGNDSKIIGFSVRCVRDIL